MINTRGLMEGNKIRYIPTGDIKTFVHGGTFKEDNYEPIPLTSEILEKWCGFICIDKANLLFKKYTNDEDNECIFIELQESGGRVSYSYKSKTADMKQKVRFLHQLQNLYYEVVRKELPVNLVHNDALKDLLH